MEGYKYKSTPVENSIVKNKTVLVPQINRGELIDSDGLIPRTIKELFEQVALRRNT